MRAGDRRPEAPEGTSGLHGADEREDTLAGEDTLEQEDTLEREDTLEQEDALELERALARLGEVRRRVPYLYTSSWPLEEVELKRPDGSALHVLVKRLGGPAPASRPGFLRDREREIAAYRLLEPERFGAPRRHANGRGWLVLEKVPGVELWQRGDLDAWRAVARWAASVHERFAGREPRVAGLLCHDEALHRRLLARALAQIGEQRLDERRSGERPLDGQPQDALARASEVAIARLAALPRTVIHGELYPSNVLLGERGRVAAVDWEMAGGGPGVLDLAALVTGWSEEGRAAIVAAYGEVEDGDLAAAELLLAVRWLGWAPGWQAPAEHRRDWLAQARAAAGRLR